MQSAEQTHYSLEDVQIDWQFKVIGVGNLHHLMERRIPMVKFVAVGADDDQEHIQSAIGHVHMAFVIVHANDVGGISTAARIAHWTRSVGALTIAVMILPSSGKAKYALSPKGYAIPSSQHFDSTLIVAHDNFVDDNDATTENAAANTVDAVHIAISELVASVSTNGMINIDISDVKLLFSGACIVRMGSAHASGAGRATTAIEQAISRASLHSMVLQAAQGVFVNITASDSLKLKEIAEIFEAFKDDDKKPLVLVSAGIDNAMGDDLRLTLFVTSPNLIRISDDGYMVDYLDHDLNEENAIILAESIRTLVASQPRRKLMLDLSAAKSMEVNAARVLADLSNIEGETDTDYPYLIDCAAFGLEQLTEEVARYLARLPSYFLHFDKVSNLPDPVARQFIGSDHALTFDGCSEISPAALRALASSACFLSLGLKNLNVFQARALAHFNGDLLLKTERLPSDVLHALGENPHLCLAPNYGLEVIGLDVIQPSTPANNCEGNNAEE